MVVDLEPVREGLRRAGADALWVHPGVELRHLTGLGHGVGLEIHEPPYLRPGNPESLQAGHVFSVEPGIYVPGSFGVRFENLVHLGEDGPEPLDAAPREPALAAGR